MIAVSVFFKHACNVNHGAELQEHKDFVLS